jgi:hypothetical protein
MPLPVAPLLGWLLGLWLAWAARGERADRPERLPGPDEPGLLLYSLFSRPERPILVAAALAAFVYAPIVGYFAAFHGDWSYLYLVPWHRIPSALDLVAVVVASATIPVGVALGIGPARAGRSALVARMAAGPLVLMLAIVGVGARRLATSASYAQFHGGFGVESITDGALGRGVLLAAIALAAALAWTVRSLRG